MNADHLFNAGLRSARAGDYHGAVTTLLLATSLGGESAEIHRLIGKAHVHLGELDQAEDSFRRALAIDFHDNGAASCLAVLRRHRIMRSIASATAIIAGAAVMCLALWFPWRAYRRLDASVAAISAPSAGRPEAARRLEVFVPAPRAETPLPAARQPSVAAPSTPATPRMAMPPPIQTQSRAAAPASPAPAGIATPPPTQARTTVVKPSSPAAPRVATPRATPPQPGSAMPLFESQYKEAVRVAFKGDLKQALALLAALSGEEYASQQLAGNVHFWMGRCLYELHQPREALDHFRRVLERYPNSPKYGEALADVDRCQRKLQTQTTKPPKP